ncbi:DUF2799 domain-containing protein [Vibrio vulnificus]|uniref:DUF2799 domain-containing protein n=1 Tax=Vibrio vulnificus TaxID=672 RepID=A0A087IGR4_VIBVL|nr:MULTISPECIES: DUF2799 domain-containing protein [Vibrio]ASM95603.1 hypothetical protein AOT11_10095 [Vibrio vulnificus NBRC 15645 = ATCC 27562]EGQ7833535.1 DUF2799 domain-containing protein [Vibrio vulnificus]EGQ7931944.1 DUF2799 domain-containing protein [Vibrio vulnificus]EGQ7934479.1 DUF2799 domain-containing protein [Vibrio vulnificus]EGQ7963124.1 DUF2799 domain-containing protein [Vibrio vulnificus]
MKNYSLAALCFIALAGCTSSTPMTSEEFWFNQGYRFGVHGYQQESESLSAIKEKVPFEQNAYMQGYEKGKKEYCDPFHAFEKGIRGIRYTGQCSEYANEAMIKAEWQRGWDTFLGADFYRFR